VWGGGDINTLIIVRGCMRWVESASACKPVIRGDKSRLCACLIWCARANGRILAVACVKANRRRGRKPLRRTFMKQCSMCKIGMLAKCCAVLS
jgi:aerobic-type carbon monoxide dehydrogenase small subunit (CoxS/CutS family)